MPRPTRSSRDLTGQGLHSIGLGHQPFGEGEEVELSSQDSATSSPEGLSDFEQTESDNMKREPNSSTELSEASSVTSSSTASTVLPNPNQPPVPNPAVVNNSEVETDPSSYETGES